MKNKEVKTDEGETIIINLNHNFIKEDLEDIVKELEQLTTEWNERDKQILLEKIKEFEQSADEGQVGLVASISPNRTLVILKN